MQLDMAFASDASDTIDEPSDRPNLISAVEEIVAYEALWYHYPTVAKLANIFRKYSHQLSSVVARNEGITAEELKQTESKIRALMPFHCFGALFYRDFEYPERLRDATHPVEVLYYRGAIDLLSSRSVSVVGARKATLEGRQRARKIAKILVENNITVMSGLAEGIDTAAHQAALEMGGRTIAVTGTPLNCVYPKANEELQAKIAREHLVISQVPFYQYSQQDYRRNRGFFPERNKTMSALSEATIIVEASDTSGSLIQARAAIEQGRKLFILKSCFERGLDWPLKFLKKGAIKLNESSDLLQHFDIEK